MNRRLEVVRVLKTQQVGHFAHAEAFHQEGFGLVDDKAVDVTDGGAAGRLVDHAAEVAGRISQFTGAPGNCRKPLFMLNAL